MRANGFHDGLSRRGFGALLAAGGVSELGAQQNPATAPATPAAADIPHCRPDKGFGAGAVERHLRQAVCGALAGELGR